MTQTFLRIVRWLIFGLSWLKLGPGVRQPPPCGESQTVFRAQSSCYWDINSGTTRGKRVLGQDIFSEYFQSFTTAEIPNYTGHMVAQFGYQIFSRLMFFKLSMNRKSVFWALVWLLTTDHGQESDPITWAIRAIFPPKPMRDAKTIGHISILVSPTS